MASKPYPILPPPIIPCPLRSQFEDWAGALIVACSAAQFPVISSTPPMHPYPIFPPSLKFPTPPKEQDWRTWVSEFMGENNLSSLPEPSERDFPGDTGWQQWGLMFIRLYGGVLPPPTPYPPKKPS